MTEPRERQDDELTMQDIADLLGVNYVSIRTYRGRSESNRRAGLPRPGDLPASDRVVSRIPLWKRSTIESWMRRRPGRGVGGGRPRVRE